MNCRCPKCNTVGERFATGEYTQFDESFECRKCGFKGKKRPE